MIRRARVLGDAQAFSKTLVEVSGASACQRCASGQGCGAGIFNQGVQSTQLVCFTSVKVSANQIVDIEIEGTDSSWLWLVAGAYGLPLLGVLLASLVANWAAPALITMRGLDTASNDGIVAVAALLGLAGGVIAWRMLSKIALARLASGLCMSSARIVSNRHSAVTPIVGKSS